MKPATYQFKPQTKLNKQPDVVLNSRLSKR